MVEIYRTCPKCGTYDVRIEADFKREKNLLTMDPRTIYDTDWLVVRAEIAPHDVYTADGQRVGTCDVTEEEWPDLEDEILSSIDSTDMDYDEEIEDEEGDYLYESGRERELYDWD